MTGFYRILVSCLRVLAMIAAFAATITMAPRAHAEPRPSVFISCANHSNVVVTDTSRPPSADCFDTYLRQELSYFDFARDPYLADFTVVVARHPAGNGGERFAVTIVARGAPNRPAQPMASFTADFGTTAYAVREQLAQLILRMLLFELRDTPHARAFALRLPSRDGATLAALDDPWNYWVFSPELSGAGEGGSGYHFVEGTAALTVRRVVEASKLRVRGSYTRNLSSYVLENGERVSGDVYGWETRALYAHSLGNRWALGGVAVGRGSEFENLSGHVHGGPLAELNLFPYRENASHQLRLAYQVGAWANWYFEDNTAGLRHELRPYHALSLIADFNQPWGSIQWVAQANSFIDAPERYRVATGAVLAIRLFAGFALNLTGEAALIRDLINLRARPITDLELLLWTAQPPTNYSFQFVLAVTYTFGSVHNTIVNSRFGRVDLAEE